MKRIRQCHSEVIEDGRGLEQGSITNFQDWRSTQRRDRDKPIRFPGKMDDPPFERYSLLGKGDGDMLRVVAKRGTDECDGHGYID